MFRFPVPSHVSFQKCSNLIFRVFTVHDIKIGMLSHWKRVSPLTFSRLTILSLRRCVYVHVCELLSEKKELIQKKWTLDGFVDLRCPLSVHQNCTPIWPLHTKLYNGVWNVSANNSETVGYRDLRLGQIIIV